MDRISTILLYPSLDIAMHAHDEAYAYVAAKFPVDSWIVRKTEILICNKYYIRFESQLNENCTRGFRGTIVSGNPKWKEVIDKIFEDAIVNNEDYPSVKILVITDNPGRSMEAFANEISKMFSDYDLWWGQYTVRIRGRHLIRFGYLNLIERDLEEFDDVILTEKSFRKYKDRILEAMK